MQEPLSLDQVAQFAKIQPTAKLALAQRAATTNGIAKAAETNPSANLPRTFSLEIETSSITDQKQSGRCWLFAPLNMLRHEIEKSHKIEMVELSQTYNYFYDKLEKANMFLETVIKFAGEPLSSRANVWFWSMPQNDGGWSIDALHLIKKYGVVPKSVMPDSFNAENSEMLNQVLNRVLRKNGLVIRAQLRGKIADDKTIEKFGSAELAAARKIKTAGLAEVYQILTVSLGTPPREFSWNYRDKKKKFAKFSGTPQDFRAQFLPDPALDLVEVANSPVHKFDQVYRWRDMGANLDQPLDLLNQPLETLKKLAIKQLRAGYGVIFYAASRQSMNKAGWAAPEIWDLNNLFDVDFDLSRADRLSAREEVADHAMLITGVDLDQNKPTAWKVENSWGDEVGDKGYWTMSDRWFNENVTGVLIRRDLLSEKLRDELKQTPIELAPWSPFA
jgi:bleomycin hydrolase